MNRSGRSMLPSLILIGVVAAPLIFILGIVTGSEIQMSSVLSADSLSSWVSAIATVAISVLTFILARETWHLRLAQIDQVNEIKRESIRPNICVEITPSKESINFMSVKISNKGKGIAKDVTFKFVDTLDRHVVVDNNVVKRFTRLTAFKNGLNTLGLEQTFSSYLLNFHDFGDEIYKINFCLVINFRDVLGNEYSNEYVLDFSEYEGISTIGTDPMYKIAREIEKIQRFYTNLSSNKRLNVNTFTEEDRAQEKANWEEHLKALKLSRSNES
ncbi:hypothetical protein BCU64_007240 [Vibrio lentus]|nr:hypothetical protein [Vibrio lentus]PMH57955.1 hypothetical protein BCU64_04985 [Vibrio lentus]